MYLTLSHIIFMIYAYKFMLSLFVYHVIYTILVYLWIEFIFNFSIDWVYDFLELCYFFIEMVYYFREIRFVYFDLEDLIEFLKLFYIHMIIE